MGGRFRRKASQTGDGLKLHQQGSSCPLILRGTRGPNNDIPKRLFPLRGPGLQLSTAVGKAVADSLAPRGQLYKKPQAKAQLEAVHFLQHKPMRTYPATGRGGDGAEAG